MTAEVQRRGAIRPISDLPVLTDPTSGLLEIEKAGLFYQVGQGLIGGADPALQPLGTELADYSSEFASDPGTWTWLNQGTSTVEFDLSRVIFDPQEGGAGTNNLRLWGPPTWPAAPWAARVRMLNWSLEANQAGGFVAYRAANARMHTYHVYRRTGPGVDWPFTEVWAGFNWTDFSTTGGTTFGPANHDVRGGDRFLQYRCDGTNLLMDVSVDNARFVNVSSVTLASFLGGEPSRIMLLSNAPTANRNALIGYDWLRVYGDAALNRS